MQIRLYFAIILMYEIVSFDPAMLPFPDYLFKKKGTKLLSCLFLQLIKEAIFTTAKGIKKRICHNFAVTLYLFIYFSEYKVSDFIMLHITSTAKLRGNYKNLMKS